METVKYFEKQLYKLPEIRYRGTRNCALSIRQKKFVLLHLFSKCKAVQSMYNNE